MFGFKRPTPSLLVAVVALFVAMSGSAVAAKLITGKQIKDHTITKRDISKATVSALRGLDGVDGIDGARGPQGPQGPAGPAGVAAITRVDGNTASQGAFGSGTEVQTSTATCPAGSYVT